MLVGPAPEEEMAEVVVAAAAAGDRAEHASS